jgi:hypothetical protein
VLEGRTTLVSMHSFTPVYHGIPRPWHAGVLYQRDGRLGQWLHARLSEDPRLQVGENEPYAMADESDYTLVVHGERRGIPHTGIEVRNDLLADVAGTSISAALRISSGPIIWSPSLPFRSAPTATDSATGARASSPLPVGCACTRMHSSATAAFTNRW